jgi:hypothetical protein
MGRYAYFGTAGSNSSDLDALVSFAIGSPSGVDYRYLLDYHVDPQLIYFSRPESYAETSPSCGIAAH